MLVWFAFLDILLCNQLLHAPAGSETVDKLSFPFSTSFIFLSPLSLLLVVYLSFFRYKELILISSLLNKEIQWWSIRSIWVLLCFSHSNCSRLLFWEPKFLFVLLVCLSCFLQGGDEDCVLPSHHFSAYCFFWAKSMGCWLAPWLLVAFFRPLVEPENV